MKQIGLIFSFVFLGYSLFCQEKYLDFYTSEIAIETHIYATKGGQNLEMDIYLPQNDPDKDRPVIVYVHGGGFQNGTRNSHDIVQFCSNFAGYGYVVVSISYRLTRKDEPSGFGCDCPVSEKLATFDAAVADIQDATSYLIQNYEYLGIDPQKIILAGSSAGAEAVLITTYSPPVCYSQLSDSIAYAGVIGMAGAIPNINIISNKSAVPSLFFHGTDDYVVPYITAPHRYCHRNEPGFLIMYGSYALANKLEDLNVPYWLHTTCGGGHEIAIKPLHQRLSEMVNFCYHFVLKQKGEFRRTIVKEKNQNTKQSQFDFCR